MFDIAGVLTLVALILVFGFLTLRAWRARNRWLKWIGSLLAGLLTLIPVALLVTIPPGSCANGTVPAANWEALRLVSPDPLPVKPVAVTVPLTSSALTTRSQR